MYKLKVDYPIIKKNTIVFKLNNINKQLVKVKSLDSGIVTKVLVEDLEEI